MDGKRLYEETLKEKNYWVAVLALSSALAILVVMLIVKAMTGNDALTLIGGLFALLVTLIANVALKVQHQATVLKLIYLQMNEGAREAQTASVYNAEGKVPDPPATGQHTDLQS